MLAINTRTTTAGLAALCALAAWAAAVHPASAQLPLGDARKIYPGADMLTRPRPAPDPTFTHGVRVLPGGGYYGGGGNVIFVNGGPCYAPGYYGGYGGYGGYYNGYNTSGFSLGFNVGGLSMGYRQSNSYNTFNNVPPPVSYDYSYGYGNAANNYQTGAVRSVPRDTVRQYDDQAPYASRRAPPPLKTAEDDSNDYYLNRKTSPLRKDPGLALAVRDIETAFRNADIRLIEKHLDASEKLTLMAMGRSRRQLEVSTYLEMTKDAFSNIKTVSYNLDKVEPASGGAWMAYGKHVLKGDDSAQQIFNVGFVLKKTTDANGAERWLITEVSADPAK